MKRLSIVLALAFLGNYSVSAQQTDSYELKEQLEQMQSQMGQLFEQLSLGFEDGKIFFIDTSFVDKYRELEFGEVEEGEILPEGLGQQFETLTEMMMQDFLKFAEGIEDFPLFQEMQPIVPAPKQEGEQENDSKQSDKQRKKRVTKTL